MNETQSNEANGLDEAEIALAQGETGYRDFIEGSLQGIWRYDFQPPMPVNLPIKQQIEWTLQNAILVEANDVYAQMYGYESVGEFIGLPVRTAWGEDQEAAITIVRDWIMQDYTFPLSETREQIPDGTYKWFINVGRAVIEDAHLVSIWGVQVDITKRKKAEKALLRHQEQLEELVAERTKELGERVKELDCLYSISRLIEQPDITLEEILQGTVELIPPGWQYPEIARARISMEDETYESKDFQKTAWMQGCTIVVHGVPSGRIDVHYLEERPLSDEGPFLKEERNLLDSIAERLGRVAERFRAEETLHNRVTELSSLHRVAQTVAAPGDLSLTLASVAEEVNGLFQARGTYFAVPDAESGELRILAGFESDSGNAIRIAEAFPLQQMPNARRALEQGQPVILTDVQAMPLAEPVRAAVSALGFHVFLLIPLTARGVVVGLLIVGSDLPGTTFTPEELALAETIAGDVATTLENARLAEEAREAAVDRERHRMARELHDSVTQTLYSIMLQTDATRLALSAGKIDVLEQRLDRLYEHTREAMTEMRLLIHELRPSILEEAGLAPALRARLEAVEVRSGLEAELQVDGERRLPPEVEAELYRVALEGLNNVLKHARADCVNLALSFDENAVRLTIRDDGVGFDLDSATRYGGYGLGIMEERVQQVGGDLRIETAPGAGTTLYVEVEA